MTFFRLILLDGAKNRTGGVCCERDELMRRLWLDSFVDEGSLAQNVSLVRKVVAQWSEVQGDFSRSILLLRSF